MRSINNRIRVTRSVHLPDLVRISRYRKAPEFGPNILFFSGGTALNETSRVIKNYTSNSIHILTPFDSGGSSAKLRQAFNMPAMGDLRSRMIALADESVTGHPEVYRLFTYRFPYEDNNAELLDDLDQMVAGKHSLVNSIPNPMKHLIRSQLGYFREAMPETFDLRGASIGNLVLTGGYLNSNRHLDPIIFLFSKLASVLGTVRAVINGDLHLVAELEDGTTIIGQHLLTGKEIAPLTYPIKNICLSSKPDSLSPIRVGVRKKTRKLIGNADLICYPPGSFYTSLLANLLPHGVTAAIEASDCPKVYVPNLGNDPEQIGMTMEDSLTRLLQYLRSNTSNKCRDDRLLNFVLVDSQHGRYPSDIPSTFIADLGLQLIDTQLVSEKSAPYYDAELLAHALLSLA